jgi:hypothetical protein
MARPGFLLPAAALLVANAWAVVGILYWAWDAAWFLLYSWAETAAVALFIPARILSAGRAGSLPARGLQALAAAVTSAAVSAGHGLVVLGLVFWDHALRHGGPDGFEAHLRSMATREAAVGLGLLFASHAHSFVANYLGRREYAETTLEGASRPLMIRAGLFNAAVLVGGALLVATRMPRMAAVGLVFAKVAADLWGLLRERAGAPRPG